jgi:hypothetical protein
MGRGLGPDEDSPSAPAWRWFLLGFVAPACVMFWDVVVHDQNFAYRDASHFYYPYYKLIADEWSAGRVPLWNPYENGGEPLAAQPTAAVWYPGKLLFLLPYPLAFKLYHLGHLVIAWWSAFWCARAFGLSRGAAAFAGTAYAFSGFVLFQLYNVVFLVGAAWLPLALAAVDRIVRSPSFGAALGMAAILAMQVLGGDPEVAILTLLVGLPYLLFFQFGRQGLWWGVGLLCLGHAAVFFGRCLPPFEFSSDTYLNPDAKTLALGWFDAAFKYPGALLTELIAAVTYQTEYGVRIGGRVHAFHLYWGWTGIAALVAGIVLLFRRGGFRALWRSQPLRMWLTAGVAAGLLSAMQILPTRELVGVSDRSAPKAPHESAAFSLFPARLLETAIPAVFGRQMPIHTRWAPFAAIENGLWTASLYMGLPAVVLGLAMLRFRKGSSHAVWLTWTFLLMLWLAVGKYGGLYWLVDPQSGHLNRPIDAPRDAKMYGASDGLYRLCEEAIPMFASFRYPEKCFLFCTLALALLAAVGIDTKIFRHPRLQRALVGAIASFAGLLMILWIARGPFERFIGGLRIPSTGFGPLDPANAWNGLMQSLVHGGFAAAAMLAVGRKTQRTTFWLTLLLAADLATANRWLIFSEPQASIDAKPKLLTVIEEAEAKDPTNQGGAQPFRIHRTRIFNPPRFMTDQNPERNLEMDRWERDTLQPKYAVPWRIPYATTTGTMSVYDIEFFFAPWPFDTPAELRRRGPHVPPRMIYYPRVGYNLWGAKYFILPFAQPLDHDERGVFTLMWSTDGLPSPRLAESDVADEDYVVVRNTEAFPLAWVVHDAEVKPPIFGLKREDRTRAMERLLYRGSDGNLRIWQKGEEYPLRSRVLVETNSPQAVLATAAGGGTSEKERVRFVRNEPGRMEMEATFERPGYVVISNTYYRGWKATIDGKEAPILRANRAMQAVGLPSGSHKITLTYSSRSVVVGGAISLAAWLALAVWFARNR